MMTVMWKPKYKRTYQGPRSTSTTSRGVQRTTAVLDLKKKKKQKTYLQGKKSGWKIRLKIDVINRTDMMTGSCTRRAAQKYGRASLNDSMSVLISKWYLITSYNFERIAAAKGFGISFWVLSRQVWWYDDHLYERSLEGRRDARRPVMASRADASFKESFWRSTTRLEEAGAARLWQELRNNFSPILGFAIAAHRQFISSVSRSMDVVDCESVIYYHTTMQPAASTL